MSGNPEKTQNKYPCFPKLKEEQQVFLLASAHYPFTKAGKLVG